MKHVTIRLPEPMLAALRLIAQREETTVSRLIRLAVKRYLIDLGEQAKPSVFQGPGPDGVSLSARSGTRRGPLG